MQVNTNEPTFAKKEILCNFLPRYLYNGLQILSMQKLLEMTKVGSFVFTCISYKWFLICSHFQEIRKIFFFGLLAGNARINCKIEYKTGTS